MEVMVSGIFEAVFPTKQRSGTTESEGDFGFHFSGCPEPTRVRVGGRGKRENGGGPCHVLPFN